MWKYYSDCHPATSLEFIIFVCMCVRVCVGGGGGGGRKGIAMTIAHCMFRRDFYLPEAET